LHVAQDEVGIVMAPFHFTGSDWLWAVPFGVGTGIAVDKDAEAIRALGIDKNREDQFRRFSDYGGLYGPTAAVGIGYFVGSATHNDHLRETAVLAGEAMIYDRPPDPHAGRRYRAVLATWHENMAGWAIYAF
jgi:hypothetical protein